MIAPWFNQINTFLYGGITQHGEFVGNVCADLNGMGGGARAHRDGEHSMAPDLRRDGRHRRARDHRGRRARSCSSTSKKIKRDNQGFGKHRGGMGYEIAVAAKGTPLWGFVTVSSGSKFPAAPRPVRRLRLSRRIPLAKIKGVNVFELPARPTRRSGRSTSRR